MLEKREKLADKLNKNNDAQDDQDTIAIGDMILEKQPDVATSNIRAKESKKTSARIAELSAKSKRCSKYISLVEGMASHEVAFPHRLAAESTFFEVVN